VHRWMHAIIFVRLQEHLADSENMLLWWHPWKIVVVSPLLQA